MALLPSDTCPLAGTALVLGGLDELRQKVGEGGDSGGEVGGHALDAGVEGACSKSSQLVRSASSMSGSAVRASLSGDAGAGPGHAAGSAVRASLSVYGLLSKDDAIRGSTKSMWCFALECPRGRRHDADMALSSPSTPWLVVTERDDPSDID